jgi:hypothetical protein
MSTIPKPEWKKLGSTSNADFYQIADDIIAVCPVPNAKDNTRSARESIKFQDDHWRTVGHKGAVVVFMDNVVDQDAGARRVYAEEVVSVPTTCYALVGESFYGYASAAVFEGLNKPGRPTNVFKSLDDAQAWIAEQNKARGGKV